MKSPLWILNSILAILLLVVLGYILFSLKNVTQSPGISSIVPTAIIEAIKKEGPKPKDIKFIYEGNDLFRTYKPEISKALNPADLIPSEPLPPRPRPIAMPDKPGIQFLEPLPIKITGIIAHSVENKSQVTILNTNTKKSESYKVGDKLFDAYIVRIFPNKVIIIRSNGQQDTIYMRPEEAEQEIKYLKEASWQDVVQQQDDKTYLIDPDNFVSRISSLANLIDMLDATTAFKQGVSIGCRIGKMNEKSIGFRLGLLPGDIVVNINNIEPTTTANRIKIYNSIQQMPVGSNILVEINRENRKIHYDYILKSFKEPKEGLNASESKQTQQNIEITNDNSPQNNQTINSNFDKTNNNRIKINSMVQDVKRRDKLAMARYGNRKSVLKGIPN